MYYNKCPTEQRNKYMCSCFTVNTTGDLINERFTRIFTIIFFSLRDVSDQTLQPIFKDFCCLIKHTMQRYSRRNTSNHTLSQEKTKTKPNVIIRHKNIISCGQRSRYLVSGSFKYVHSNIQFLNKS